MCFQRKSAYRLVSGEVLLWRCKSPSNSLGSIWNEVCVHVPSPAWAGVFFCCCCPWTSGYRLLSLWTQTHTSNSRELFQAFSLWLGLCECSFSFWSFQLLGLSRFYFAWLFSLKMALRNYSASNHVSQSNKLSLTNGTYSFGFFLHTSLMNTGIYSITSKMKQGTGQRKEKKSLWDDQYNAMRSRLWNRSFGTRV